MGTHYYAIVKESPVCDKVKSDCPKIEKRLHIGKSSGGWCFALRVYPERGLVSLASWKNFFKRHKLFDEYGRLVHADEMVNIITDRSFDGQWADKDLAENHAERGPNNLARSRVDGYRCVGNGLGTWDYFLGEFS